MRLLLKTIFPLLTFFLTISACSGDETNYQTTPLNKKKWTVMIYMDGDCDLETYAINDFNEIEKGLFNAIHSNGNIDIQDNLNVVVLFDRTAKNTDPGHTTMPTQLGGGDWTTTRLYRVLPDNDPTWFASERLDDGAALPAHIQPIGEKNMGDPATLDWFIGYCKEYLPAEKYALIFWNHGGGARKKSKTSTQSAPQKSSIKEVCYDSDNGEDYLFTDEIQQALSKHFNIVQKLDIIGFDACLMGMVEVGYEFRNLASYMVASMNSEQADGWDYEYIFSNLADTKDESVISAADFSKLIVTAYMNYIDNIYSYGGISGETLSAVDLTQMENLKTKIDALAVALDNENNKSDIQTCRDLAIHFYSSDSESCYYPFYDLQSFCNLLSLSSAFTSNLKEKANQVLSALDNAVIWSYGDSGNGQSRYYGKSNRGLSICFPRGNYTMEISSGVYVSIYLIFGRWYSSTDVSSIGKAYYGKIDFCTFNNNGVVESWVEMIEKWYDPSNIFTETGY